MTKTSNLAGISAIAGSIFIAGCGIQGGIHTTTAPTSRSAGGSPTVEVSAQTSASTIPSHSSTPTSHAVFSNASSQQLAQWAKSGTLYQLSATDSNSTPGITGTILVIPTFSIPMTLHHWPSTRFRAIAALNNPQTQLGTGTGTLWINMSHAMYWLKPISSTLLPTSIDVSASPTAVENASGTLFGVPWPDATYPARVLFLQSIHPLVPSAITNWPSPYFRVVAVIKSSDIPTLPWWSKLRTLNIAPGVEVSVPQ